jgi:hypothetical protein
MQVSAGVWATILRRLRLRGPSASETKDALACLAALLGAAELLCVTQHPAAPAPLLSTIPAPRCRFAVPPDPLVARLPFTTRRRGD